MAKYIGNVIHQINYNANFNYNIQELPNPTYKNDSEAAKKWVANRNQHIKSVISAWRVDTGIEQAEEYQQGNHPEVLSLKDIAKDEFEISRDEVIRIEKVLQTHDRSRFADDEFFPMANRIYSSRKNEQPPDAYNISRLKHYHRNAHHLEHYYFYNINTTGDEPDIVTVPMPDNYIWELLADWLSDKNLTSNMYEHSPQPFYFYWRSKYKFLYDRHTKWESEHHDDDSGEDSSDSGTRSASRSSDSDDSEGGEVDEGEGESNGYTVYTEYEYYTKTYLEPVLPTLIPIHPSTAARIRSIVDRWQPLDDRDPEDYPDEDNARPTGNEYVVPDEPDEDK